MINGVKTRWLPILAAPITVKKGGTMKTVALLALLAIAVVSTSGCHWRHHRHNNYGNGYYSR